MKFYYVYVLQSLRLEKKLYTGYSDNLERRYSEHKSGGVHTTKRMLPVKLVFYESFLSEKDARRRERYFKTSKGKSSLRQIIRESLK